MTRTPCIALVAALFCCGCVATQNVPVSTDPSGAVVYLDGKQMCAATPCSVAIPKNQDHLLTLIKPGYHQRDVPVRRVFDTANVLREGAAKSARAVAGGSGVGDALAGAAADADKRERDGSAYVLKPNMVALRLVPADQPQPEAQPQSTDPYDDTPMPQAKPRSQDPADPVELGLELYRLLEQGNKQGAQ